ncbi:MAG: hypothetical protein WD969_16460, partial [Paracoccaceae bacterium]
RKQRHFSTTRIGMGRRRGWFIERVHHPTMQVSVTARMRRAFCAERLSDYKIPDVFTLADTPLPRNANGKVMKQELRRIAAEDAG